MCLAIHKPNSAAHRYVYHKLLGLLSLQAGKPVYLLCNVDIDHYQGLWIPPEPDESSDRNNHTDSERCHWFVIQSRPVG